MTTRVHGGLHEEELRALGIDPSSVVDFSVNVNPYGPSPRVLQAIREAPLDRYPDPAAVHARAAVAAVRRVEPDCVAVGHGATDLIWTLAWMLGRGARLLSVEPTFGEMAAAWNAAGGSVDAWRARAEDGFAVDLDAVVAAARGAAVVSIGVPNNPTGAAVRMEALAAAAAELPDVLWMLDESFLSLSERSFELQHALPSHVVRVRSLTKEHTLPGLRIGYLLATPELCRRLEAARPAWSTSAPAQAAIVAACHEAGFVDDCRERVLGDRGALAAELQGLGLRPVPSAAPFLLVEVPDAASLRERLLRRHRILVRDCASFGLPRHVRVAARPAADRARLVVALEQEM